MDRTPFQIAYDELKALGLVLTCEPGCYRVNFRNGTAATEYCAEELPDALAHGREMAAEERPQTAALPLGPTGSRNSRRGLIYRHNRKLAARRIADAAKGK